MIITLATRNVLDGQPATAIIGDDDDDDGDSEAAFLMIVKFSRCRKRHFMELQQAATHQVPLSLYYMNMAR